MSRGATPFHNPRTPCSRIRRRPMAKKEGASAPNCLSATCSAKFVNITSSIPKLYQDDQFQKGLCSLVDRCAKSRLLKRKTSCTIQRGRPTWRRVFTTSRGFVRNAEVQPPSRAARACTRTTSDPSCLGGFSGSKPRRLSS